MWTGRASCRLASTPAQSLDGRLWFQQRCEVPQSDQSSAHSPRILFRRPWILALVADLGLPRNQQFIFPHQRRYDLEVDYTALSFVAPQCFCPFLRSRCWLARAGNTTPEKHTPTTSLRGLTLSRDCLQYDGVERSRSVIVFLQHVQTAWFRALCVAAFAIKAAVVHLQNACEKR